MNTKLPWVAITMGDPAGVGPEIIPKALSDPNIFNCCRPVIYGNLARLQAGASSTGTSINFYVLPALHEGCHDPDGVPVIDPIGEEPLSRAWGTPTAANGKAMAAYLNRAIDDALAGKIAAIATGPINKFALKLAGVPFQGHTEILVQRTHTQNYAMMLAGNRLKVVLATIHIPLCRVAAELTTEGLAGIVTLTHDALKNRFGIPVPRIAVAGLNPHAGEGGLFGDEEATVIRPAVDQTASQGITVSGPHPPDTVFHKAAEGAYDAVVAMYHDQGLAPFKMIHFKDGVNTTLGLPLVRTSVDHGTAYDIAGTGQASAASLQAAIVMAAFQVRWLSRFQPQPDPIHCHHDP